MALGRAPGHIYSRNTNPTVHAFEEKVRLLEGAEAATSFATGMAAVSNTLFTLLSPGDRVVSVKDTYGGTNKIFTEFLPRFGIEVDALRHHRPRADRGRHRPGLPRRLPGNAHQPDAQGDGHRPAGRGRRTRPARSWSPTTPLPRPSTRTRWRSAPTWCCTAPPSSWAATPTRWAASSAALRSWSRKIYHYREITGATLDPMAAYLLIRGMKTLDLRVRQQNESALRIARWLQAQPAVAAVYYPGLETHPHHDVARRQMRGFGGVLSFMLEGGFEAVKRVLPRLRFAHRAANLGAVETIAGPPATTSHVECTAEEREAMGIPEGLIRYSVGIEDADDLIADLTQALAVG